MANLLLMEHVQNSTTAIRIPVEKTILSTPQVYVYIHVRIYLMFLECSILAYFLLGVLKAWGHSYLISSILAYF